MSTKVTSGEGVDRIQAFPPSSDMSHSSDRAAGRESLGMRVTSVGVPCHLAQCVLYSSVNTKVEVRFHVDSADWLPGRVKGRLKTMVSM